MPLLPQRHFHLIAALLPFVEVVAAPHAAERPPEPAHPSQQSTERSLTIQEYRIEGSQKLSQLEVEEAVYPFMGEERTSADVEQARAALEKAYRAKGFQTISVEVPQQTGAGGVVILNVVEGRVAKLRVKGSRYFSLSHIKSRVPSLAQGSVPNFNDVTREMIALNQWPDRRVTPELRLGEEPGTVDIDLVVKDTLPLHGSLELNNRYSANTTELRVNGGLSYGNLWQRGHGIGFNFQIAPERTEDAKVYSAYYLMRFESLPSLTLTFSGTKQDSNVSTLGGVAVAGRGEILGAHASISLPVLQGYYHSVSLGFDYKHFDENIVLGISQIATPITYYPFSLGYNGTWIGKGRTTEFNAAANFHFRGMGSDPTEFDAKRYKADGSYLYLRGDLSHRQTLPADFELHGKVQGQLASRPLLNSEQYAAGGIGTVRGYLESAVLGDNGFLGTVELHSPSFIPEKLGEWRVYGFFDAGVVTLTDPLPQQEDAFQLASVGFGSRLQLFNFLNGSIDAGFPLARKSDPLVEDMLLTFRVWAEF